MKKNQFYRFAKNEAGDIELFIEGVIASESWWDDEITPKDFRKQLDAHKGQPITVRINSPGGDVFAGVQIHNMLKDRDGDVTVIVDALAASAASFVAMAGDKIIMNTGSMMMIHKASTIAWGNEDDMVAVIEMLQKVDESIISFYVARTGKTDQEIKDLLAAETWMTAEEAVEMGFADEFVAGKTKLSNIVKNALGFSQEVKNADMQPLMNLKMRLESKSEKTKKPVAKKVTEPSAAESKPKPVAKETPIVKTKAELEAEAKAAADALAKFETDNMSEADKLAAAAVIEPKNQAPVVEKPTEAKGKKFLKSKAALEAFALVLKDNAGKTGDDVKAAWQKVLVKNGLTDPDYFQLPDPIITSIQDAVKASGIFNLLNKTGLDVFRAVYDDTDAEADTSRAGNHNKGDTKDEQILDFNDRILRPKYIYKYLVLNKEDIREQKSTGALIRFVLNELPTRIIREIERAVVIGDGRATDNKRHITSFVSIKSDAAANAGAGNAFATTYTPGVGESHYESIIRALDLILTDGDVYIVSKRGYLTDLRLETNVNGGYVFAPGTNVVEAMGLAGSFRPTWFKDATDSAYDAYLVVFSAYYTVGDNSVEAFTNFKLETNEEEFLQELYTGGGLTSLIAAVGIAHTENS